MALSFTQPAPAESAGPPPRHDSWAHRADIDLLHRVADRLITTPAERQRFFRSNAQFHAAGMTDFFFGTPGQNADPDRLFDALRWGGQFIYCTPSYRDAAAVLERYRYRPEFMVEQEPQPISAPRVLRLGHFSARVPFLEKRCWFFVVRKILITRPSDPTDRYSYDVRLIRNGSPNHYVVQKQVPTFEHACIRLAGRFPDQSREMIENGARKLVTKVFPVFLTREAALLKILQRDLPDEYRDRFPTALNIDQDDRGLVRRMTLNWLRLGGEPMSQIEFARQALDCLRVLHDTVGVMHLDLRLDNMVITPRGVGFLDFGSAVRVGEDFSTNPMLETLFSELLSTSQIQRDLQNLIKKGRVTSRLFTDASMKIDKAFDLFYLVLQMNNPHANPDFRGLVSYFRQSAEARAIAKLSRAVLQPKDPSRTPYRTAAEVLQGVEMLQESVAR